MAGNFEKIKTSKKIREDVYRKDRGTKYDRKIKREAKRETGDLVEKIVDRGDY
jgi:hypothetical protein